MSRSPQFYTLNVPASGNAGEAQRVDNLTHKYLQVAGAIAGTVALEGRMAPAAEWTTLVASLAEGFQDVPETVYAVRLNNADEATPPAIYLGGLIA